MNPDRQQAIQYLRTTRDGLWQWTENGAVLTWHDGTTIAFREEIVQILEWLAPNHLPSFGAIVFLLAACRGKVPSVADVITISDALPTGMGKDAAVLVGARKQLQAQLTAALEQLRRVSQLPTEIISGIKPKCVLAEAVFEPAKAERHVDAQAVLRGMREPIGDAELVDADGAAIKNNYVRQIHILAEGLKPHTAESLALRLRTGLDALPKEADADLPAAERARRLIEELSRDREVGAVARAARELMAAVRLPRRLGERDELALGGVSDITNRGPLDRLLISELAHDDLTLSVRVALNEALYLRREPPMREPPAALALLLDSGVRLWGVPRVLATAVALALIARDKQHSEILAWRARGKDLHNIDLLSRNGLIQHLNALEPFSHAGDSLAEFADATADNPQNQSVLITHRDAIDDPDFRRAIAQQSNQPSFVATVDREGHFELHQTPLAHRLPICQSDLDLNSIFDEKRSVTPIKTEVDPNLPAIFGMSPFPFLLPVTGKVEFWTKGSDGCTYAVLNDRRLVRYRDTQHGARVLATDLPGGKIIWMDCDGNEVHLVKAGASQRPARLLTVSLPHGELRVSDLATGPEIHAVHRYGEAIVLIRRTDVRAYSLSDGRFLGSAVNPHRWMHGRFFHGTNHFFFGVWDGERVKFEPVSIPSQYLHSSVAAVFDREGYSGPWMVCRNGSVVSTESGDVIKLPRPSGVELLFGAPRVSNNGRHLLVMCNRKDPRGGWFSCLMDLVNPTAENVQYCHEFPKERPLVPTWNMYQNVSTVGAAGESIGFCGRRNIWRKIGVSEGGRIHITDTSPQANPYPFLRLLVFGEPQKTKHGCTLWAGELPGGNKVFLDSRGLLHFKSPDPNVPEVSLVLSDGEVAGWTSDGHVCGPRFFFEESPLKYPRKVFERLMKFFPKQ